MLNVIHIHIPLVGSIVNIFLSLYIYIKKIRDCKYNIYTRACKFLIKSSLSLKSYEISPSGNIYYIGRAPENTNSKLGRSTSSGEYFSQVMIPLYIYTWHSAQKSARTWKVLTDSRELSMNSSTSTYIYSVYTKHTQLD